MVDGMTSVVGAYATQASASTETEFAVNVGQLPVLHAVLTRVPVIAQNPVRVSVSMDTGIVSCANVCAILAIVHIRMERVARVRIYLVQR